MDEITVLMSAYNGERYIKEQIDSIRCQKEVKVNLLIRDDGSLDTTLQIILEYKKCYPSFSLDVIAGDNMGYVQSFTELVKIALERFPNCQYFAFSDHDDVWLDNKLDRAISMLNQYDAPTANIPLLYCSNAMMVDSNLVPIGLFFNKPREVSKAKCLIENIAIGCTTVFNRKAACLFVERQIPKITVHDQFLYIICTLLGRTIYDHESYILYRQHGGNQVGKPSVLKKYQRSLKKLTKNTHSLEDRAKNFLLKFDDLLSDEDKAVLSTLRDYKSSMQSRFRLILDHRFRYSSLMSNVVFIVKIIIGRV